MIFFFISTNALNKPLKNPCAVLFRLEYLQLLDTEQYVLDTELKKYCALCFSVNSLPYI